MIRKVIESVGIITLLFTILGVVTAIDWSNMTPSTYYVSAIGISIISISLVCSVFRVYGFLKLTLKFMFIISCVLFIFTTIIFFFFSQFFTETLNFPSHFWAVVSLYSIPAICAEGALFNFFFYYPPWSMAKSNITIPAWYGWIFVTYASCAILINFLAIFKVITPHTHIMSARIILSIALCGYIIIYKKLRTI